MASAAQLKTDDRRQALRTPVGRPGVLRIGSARESILIDDITRDGCRIVTDRDLEPEQLVTLGIAGVGTVDAIVAWRSVNAYGCAFTTTLPAGAITAANSANVVALANDDTPPAATTAFDTKWQPRQRAVAIVGSTVLLWSVAIAAAWGVLHSVA